MKTNTEYQTVAVVLGGEEVKVFHTMEEARKFVRRQLGPPRTIEVEDLITNEGYLKEFYENDTYDCYEIHECRIVKLLSSRKRTTKKRDT